MKNRKFYIWGILLAVIACTIQVKGQQEHKRELRATWIATVANIDWPKSYDPEVQKQDLIRMLDLYAATNINTVFFHVRTECDAFYNSSYEPWSRFLTGTQGKHPGYDPLQFAINEGHKRGIEVHAWMNPYRLSSLASPGEGYFDDEHVYKEHPEWTIKYDDGKYLLNPGIPEVMSYIGAVVRDLISKYNVDGMHFDDYFYAYSGTPTSLDSAEYNTYGNGQNLSDWRRNNINRMIDTVYKVIQEEKPSLRFGISPFGIYKNGVPTGIQGMDAYKTIYCDPLAWLNNASVDYLTPQLYWPTGGKQDFETLANWWADSVYVHNRHLFTGHGSYRLANNPSAKTGDTQVCLNNIGVDNNTNLSTLEMGVKGTDDPVSEWTLSEFGKQIYIVRQNYKKGGLGNVFFSAKDFERVNGFADYLRENKYTHKTLWPEMTWKNALTPETPANLTLKSTFSGDALTWDYSGNSSDRFVIYVANDSINAKTFIDSAKHLQKVVWENQILLSDINIKGGSKIVVTALSQVGTEGAPSEIYQIHEYRPVVTIVDSNMMDTVGFSSKLSWSSNVVEPTYFLQIATNKTFSNVVYESGPITDSAISVNNLGLTGERIYFWRVKVKDGNEGPYSDHQLLYTGYPATPTLAKPTHLQELVAHNPKIYWKASSGANEIEVLISEHNDSSNNYVNEKFAANTDFGKLTTTLKKDTWYHIKLRALNNYGNSLFSDTVSFKTSPGEIPQVQLIEPTKNSVVASYNNLKWRTTASEGNVQFRLELASNENFSANLKTRDWATDTIVKLESLNLQGERTYFWRVKAKSEFGEGDYSETWTYDAGYPMRPSIVSPKNKSENNDITPTIKWNVSDLTDSVRIEISENNNYSDIEHTETFDASTGEGTISHTLKSLTYYYLRIVALNNYGESMYSSETYFRTSGTNNVDDNISQSIKIYPNPSRGSIMFSNTNNASIKIYSFDGSLVKEFQNVNSGQNYSLNLKNGIYLIKASALGKVEKQKLVICR